MRMKLCEMLEHIFKCFSHNNSRRFASHKLRNTILYYFIYSSFFLHHIAIISPHARRWH